MKRREKKRKKKKIKMTTITYNSTTFRDDLYLQFCRFFPDLIIKSCIKLVYFL